MKRSIPFVFDHMTLGRALSEAGYSVSFTSPIRTHASKNDHALEIYTNRVSSCIECNDYVSSFKRKDFEKVLKEIRNHYDNVRSRMRGRV